MQVWFRVGTQERPASVNQSFLAKSYSWGNYTLGVCPDALPSLSSISAYTLFSCAVPSAKFWSFLPSCLSLLYSQALTALTPGADTKIRGVRAADHTHQCMGSRGVPTECRLLWLIRDSMGP